MKDKWSIVSERHVFCEADAQHERLFLVSQSTIPALLPIPMKPDLEAGARGRVHPIPLLVRLLSSSSLAND